MSCHPDRASHTFRTHNPKIPPVSSVPCSVVTSPEVVLRAKPMPAPPALLPSAGQHEGGEVLGSGQQGEARSTLLCASLLLERLAQRLSRPPRLPSAREARTAVWLRTQCSTAFAEASHTPLLRRLWGAAFADLPFQRRSPRWCSLGFQQRDPASDVRGGGTLCLLALCHLAEEQPGVLLHLLRAQERRQSRRGPYSSYPLACAAIAIARAIAEFFQAVAPGTGKPNTQVDHVLLGHWHLLRSQAHFYGMFTAAMLHLDATWDQRRAGYMEFNAVFRQAMADFFDAMQRLPHGVGPSPLSFASEELLEALDADSQQASAAMLAQFLLRGGEVEAAGAAAAGAEAADAGMLDDGDDVGKQGWSSPLPATEWAAAPAGLSPPSPPPRVHSVDLLGLDSLAEDLRREAAAQEPSNAPKWPGEGHGQETVHGVGFFESFGLED